MHYPFSHLPFLLIHLFNPNFAAQTDEDPMLSGSFDHQNHEHHHQHKSGGKRRRQQRRMVEEEEEWEGGQKQQRQWSAKVRKEFKKKCVYQINARLA
jgi:hypothetical protein